MIRAILTFRARAPRLLVVLAIIWGAAMIGAGIIRVPAPAAAAALAFHIEREDTGLVFVPTTPSGLARPDFPVPDAWPSIGTMVLHRSLDVDRGIIRDVVTLSLALDRGQPAAVLETALDGVRNHIESESVGLASAEARALIESALLSGSAQTPGPRDGRRDVAGVSWTILSAIGKLAFLGIVVVGTIHLVPEIAGWIRRGLDHRHKDGNRCRACGYDIRSLDRCPECGTARSEPG